MTQKQKLKSLEKKIERIKNSNTDFDFEKANRLFFDIQRFHNLKLEHFHLQFEIEHCSKCHQLLPEYQNK
jgi:hypothetical protein